MAGWRCNCVFCRLLVHPILRRVAGLSVERRRELPVKAAPLSGAEREAGGAPAEEGVQGVQARASAVVDVESIARVLAESIGGQLETTVSKLLDQVRGVLEENSKVLVERLDRVEENVGRLRKELQTIVSSLENIVVEFREALTEMTNPLVGSQQSFTVSGSAGLEASIAAVVRGVVEAVERAGVNAVVEVLSEYRKAGIIDDSTYSSLVAIARTADKLLKSGVSKNAVLSLALQVLGGLKVSGVASSGKG